MRKKYVKIFVLYPKGLKTGGPEALHQLVDGLRCQGQNAYLVPYKNTKNNLAVAEYAHYDAPEVTEVVDEFGNAIVFPEIDIVSAKKFSQADKFCWWLSIDNSALFSHSMVNKFYGLKLAKYPLYKHIFRKVCALTEPVLRKIFAKFACNNLVQSSYAWSVIATNFGAPVSMLSDYTLAEDYLGTKILASKRGKTVAYNPKKGAEIVAKLQAACGDNIVWVPIENMSRKEVAQTLKNTAIYLDLGNHPGKDRLTREAALAGALVLVARRGSGSFYADVPLPWEHKITLNKQFVTQVHNMLLEILQNVDIEVLKQNKYREIIVSEKKQFFWEIRDIFIDGKFGKDRLDYL